VNSTPHYKMDVDPSRLIFEKEKFAPHVMVSSGISVAGKGQLHFVDEKAKLMLTTMKTI